jgi:peptidoglycan/LPS O-acetylase OafA/YrhL
MAALLVLASHARHFGLEDYASQASAGLIATLFYGATALGHQAVIIFFVLSGFLISGSVSRSVAAGRWQWRDYLSRRLARLWTVLLPCLALTAAVDLAAIHLTASRFYDGDLTFYSSGPGPSGAVHDPATFVANVLFLQGLVSPVFGSNGPLWSLANEFWYYLLFAALFRVAPARWRTVVLLTSALAAYSIGFLLDERLLYLWPAWLVGYGVLRLLPTVTRWRAAAPRLTTFGGLTIAAGLAVPAALLAGNPPLADLTLALAVAFVVLLLATIRSAPSPLRLLADGLARISYSLYLSHFPVLAMLSAVVLGNQRLPFGWQGVATFGLFVAVGLSVAVFLYWAFERHTARVRYALARLLHVR